MNTVTVIDREEGEDGERYGDRILNALRGFWPDADLLREPERLTGGYWATMWRLQLAGTPAGVPGDVVLRLVPDATMGAKEMAVQAAAARGGVPTPRVHLTAPAGGPLTRAWALMDLAPGAPLLGSLDGAAALRRFPRLAAALPRRLADTMAAIHRLDPAPVVAAAREAAPSAAVTFDESWPHLRAAVAAAGRADLDDAWDRLVAGRPRRAGPVVCHGDIHPFNLLVDGARTTVLDWTGAVAAPAAYDVAFTWLLLRHPPLVAPAALRPAVGVAAAALASRFVRLYRRANPEADLTELRWYIGVRALRIVADLEVWSRNGDPRARAHPLRLVAPGALQALRRAIRRPAVGSARAGERLGPKGGTGPELLRPRPGSAVGSPGDEP